MGLPNFSSPNQEDNWLQDKVIKKTFVSIKQFWGKSGKHDFWTIVSYYEGSPFLIVRKFVRGIMYNMFELSLFM